MPGSTIWIHLLNDDLVCYFDTMEEGFEYGHAYLKEHSYERNVNTAHKTDYYNCYGQAMFYNYISEDSFEKISKNSYGNIGLTNSIQISLYKKRTLPYNLWSYVKYAIVIEPGIALTKFNTIENKDLKRDGRIFICTISDTKHWRNLLNTV